MQRDRRRPPDGRFYIAPALALLAACSGIYTRYNAVGEDETISVAPPPVPSPVPTLAPAQRRLKEPLPPLKPVPPLPEAAQGPAPRYQVRALPRGFDAADLSDTGVVVGSVMTKQGESIAESRVAAALWKSGKTVYLPGNGKPRCFAEAINASGVIAGDVGTYSKLLGGDSGSDVVLWSRVHPRRGPKQLKCLSYGDHPAVRVVRINRYGQLLGNAGMGSTFDLTELEAVSEEYGGGNAGSPSLSFVRDDNKTHIIAA